jgi:hypothetical protein
MKKKIYSKEYERELSEPEFLKTRGFSYLTSQAEPCLEPATGVTKLDSGGGVCKEYYEGVVYPTSGHEDVRWDTTGSCPKCSCACVVDFNAEPTGEKSNLDYGEEWQTEKVTFNVTLNQETLNACVITLTLDDGGMVRVNIPAGSDSGSKTVWVYSSVKSVSYGG